VDLCRGKISLRAAAVALSFILCIITLRTIDSQKEIHNRECQPKDGVLCQGETQLVYEFLPVGALAMGAGGPAGAGVSELGGGAALPSLSKLSKLFSGGTILLRSIFAHESLQQGRESADSTPPLIDPVDGEARQVRHPFCLWLSWLSTTVLSSPCSALVPCSAAAAARAALRRRPSCCWWLGC